MPFTMAKIPFAVHIHNLLLLLFRRLSIYIHVFVGFWKFKLHLRSPRSYIFICIKKYFQYFCINWFYLPPGVYNTTFKLLRAWQNFFTHKENSMENVYTRGKFDMGKTYTRKNTLLHNFWPNYPLISILCGTYIFCYILLYILKMCYVLNSYFILYYILPVFRYT